MITKITAWDSNKQRFTGMLRMHALDLLFYVLGSIAFGVLVGMVAGRLIW